MRCGGKKSSSKVDEVATSETQLDFSFSRKYRRGGAFKVLFECTLTRVVRHYWKIGTKRTIFYFIQHVIIAGEL